MNEVSFADAKSGRHRNSGVRQNSTSEPTKNCERGWQIRGKQSSRSQNTVSIDKADSSAASATTSGGAASQSSLTADSRSSDMVEAAHGDDPFEKHEGGAEFELSHTPSTQLPPGHGKLPLTFESNEALFPNESLFWQLFADAWNTPAETPSDTSFAVRTWEPL